MLTVFIKFDSLSSWLLLAPLAEILARNPIEVAFEPMVDTLGNVAGTPRADDPLATYKARRAAARDAAAARETQRQCQKLQLPVSQAAPEIDAGMLARGLIWANRHGTTNEVLDYLEGCFDQVFREQADVAEPALVTGMLADAGIATDGFAEFAAACALPDAEALMERSIFAAPALLLDDEVYLGREHLPLIEWQISGRQGPPPV